MNEDMEEALKKLKFNVKPLKLNSSTREDKSNKTLELIHYYQQLDQRQIAFLQSLYRFDFTLLGYNSKPPHM